MDQLTRIRYVTTNYVQLQGLKVVPLGVLFLGSALWRLGLGQPFTAEGIKGGRVFFVAAVLAGTGWVAFGQVYRRWFGRVRPLAQTTQLVSMAALLAIFGALVWLQGAVPALTRVPLGVVFAGVILLSIGLAHGRMRKHYVAVGAGCLAFAALVLGGAPLRVLDVGLDALIGLGLVIGGLGDHLILRRMLRAPQDHGRAAAV